jgi:hypothetical protein
MKFKLWIVCLILSASSIHLATSIDSRPTNKIQPAAQQTADPKIIAIEDKPPSDRKLAYTINVEERPKRSEKIVVSYAGSLKVSKKAFDKKALTKKLKEAAKLRESLEKPVGSNTRPYRIDYEKELYFKELGGICDVIDLDKESDEEENADGENKDPVDKKDTHAGINPCILHHKENFLQAILSCEAAAEVKKILEESNLSPTVNSRDKYSLGMKSDAENFAHQLANVQKQAIVQNSVSSQKAEIKSDYGLTEDPVDTSGMSEAELKIYNKRKSAFEKMKAIEEKQAKRQQKIAQEDAKENAVRYHRYRHILLSTIMNPELTVGQIINRVKALKALGDNQLFMGMLDGKCYIKTSKKYGTAISFLQRIPLESYRVYQTLAMPEFPRKNLKDAFGNEPGAEPISRLVAFSLRKMWKLEIIAQVALKLKKLTSYCLGFTGIFTDFLHFANAADVIFEPHDNICRVMACKAPMVDTKADLVSSETLEVYKPNYDKIEPDLESISNLKLPACSLGDLMQAKANFLSFLTTFLQLSHFSNADQDTKDLIKAEEQMWQPQSSKTILQKIVAVGSENSPKTFHELGTEYYNRMLSGASPEAMSTMYEKYDSENLWHEAASDMLIFANKFITEGGALLGMFSLEDKFKKIAMNGIPDHASYEQFLRVYYTYLTEWERRPMKLSESALAPREVETMAFVRSREAKVKEAMKAGAESLLNGLVHKGSLLPQSKPIFIVPHNEDEPPNFCLEHNDSLI